MKRERPIDRLKIEIERDGEGHLSLHKKNS
jgi:hypothetical protein